MARLVALCALLFAGSALAADPAPLAELAPPAPHARAVQLFEQGDYPRARTALAQLVADPARDEREKGPSRLYLAATLHALNEAAAAFDALRELAALHPEQPIDPVLFLPDFIALAKKAAAQVALERQAAEAAQAASPPAPPAASSPPAAPAALAAAAPVAAPSTPATRWLAYGAWVLGAGSMVAGAGTGIAATLDRNRLAQATAQVPVTSLTQREAAGLSARSASLGQATNVLLVAGALAVAGGAALWIAGSEVAVSPTPTGAVVSGTLP